MKPEVGASFKEATPSLLDRFILPNGQTIYINDHVYSAAPWGVRDSSLPYSIGRVMEFLPSEDHKGNNRAEIARTRIAWFYRPSDLSDRPTLDSRLLLAAIYSEVQPISYIRGKCYVRHRDMIQDLNAWRKTPDSFYFFRFFDPYIKKEYEVLRSQDVNNLPQHIKLTLTQRYQFIVAEKEVVPDLLDSLRSCDTCADWCPPADTVRCDRCKKFFHMQCVHPPLAAKPAKGYGWTCAPCSKKHDELVDSQGVRSESPPRIVRTRAKASQVVDSLVPPLQPTVSDDTRYFKMWPFRYFGLHTTAEDALDPDDSIFPRSATRVGPKYQAVCPPLKHPDRRGRFPTNEDRPPTSSSREVLESDDKPQRGGDETIEVISSICTMSPGSAEAVEFHKNRLWHKPEQKYLVDIIDECLRRYSAAKSLEEIEHVKMKGIHRRRKWQLEETRYFDSPWSDEESKVFHESILAHGGAEMRAIQRDVKTRPIPELVRYYGKWKNEQLRLQRKKAEKRHNQAQSTKLDIVFSMTQGASEASSENDHDSVYALSLPLNKSCGACKTKASIRWWKPPRALDLTSPMLCDDCSMSWRKYADLKIGRTEESAKAKPVAKREGSPLTLPQSKRSKIGLKDVTPPHSEPKVLCSCCSESGLSEDIFSCEVCGVAVHPGKYLVGSAGRLPLESFKDCAGIPTNVDQEWLCDVCENERTMESSMDTRCLICASQRVPGEDGSLDDYSSYLRIRKPTENRGWVHALCAIFCPEVQFTDSSQLRLVEGLSAIADWKRTMKCSICHQHGGAVVKCESGDLVHISCAWRNGFIFGFEILPVKVSRNNQHPVVSFHREIGVITPVIAPSSTREIHGPCERDEYGKTILQLYCEHYKQAPLTSYGLLRKARRLDDFLLHSTPSRIIGLSDPECGKCRTSYSPYFWTDNGATYCHQCWRKFKNT